jgi:thiol-disulfide isomerase/thioredoxin
MTGKNCVALLALALGCIAATKSAVRVGDPFPNLRSFTLEGEIPVTLKGKVVVVDFWASWCAPCKDTFPMLEELHHRFGKDGLVIIAVNEDKSRAAMNEFLKGNPVTFCVVRDEKRKLAAHVNVPALPTSYVLDREGKVLAIESGARVAQNRKAFVKRVEQWMRDAQEKL